LSAENETNVAGQNLNVGSTATRQIVTVEVGPGEAKAILEIQGDHSAYFHENEYLRLGGTQYEDSIVSSKHRRAVF